VLRGDGGHFPFYRPTPHPFVGRDASPCVHGCADASRVVGLCYEAFYLHGASVLPNGIFCWESWAMYLCEVGSGRYVMCLLCLMGGEVVVEARFPGSSPERAIGGRWIGYCVM